MEPIVPPFLPPDMPYLRLNDALVFGDWPDPTILDRPIMTNIAACKATLLWKPVPSTVRGLFDHYSRHVESSRKDGTIMFPGTLDETRSRRCDNVLAFDLVVYDFDGTMSVSEAWTCALNSGCTFAMYSSPSHLLKGIEKFRLAFPLDGTFVLKESDLLRRKEEWLVRYKHVADTFGFAIDKTGGDLNRAFNSPRHRPNAPYFTWIVGGSVLQLPGIKLPAHRKPTRKKKAEPAEGLFFDDPELVPGYDDDAGEEHEALNIDKALRKRVGKFIRSRGIRFAVADFIESIGWDTVSQEQDKITLLCPNRDQHSDPEQENDTACAALNPDASPNGRAAITCLHAHCRHLRTSDLLTMMLEQIDLDNPIELMREHVYRSQ